LVEFIRRAANDSTGRTRVAILYRLADVVADPARIPDDAVDDVWG
jgi:hypothetical protein